MRRWLAFLFLGLVGASSYLLTRFDFDEEPDDLDKDYWGYD